MQRAGDGIVAGVRTQIPAWVVRSVERIVTAWGRLSDDDAVTARADAGRAGSAAAERVARELAALFDLDPAEQRSTPLNIVRSAYREPTQVLERYGIPDVVRDPFDERHAPDDRFDLAPRSLSDLGAPELGPLLLAWGLAKARLLRERSDGNR